MRKKFDLGTVGAPSSEDRHHRIREFGSLIAAVSAAAAALVVGFLIVGGHDALKAVGAWILLALLIAIWLSGLWWRWDSPDRRKKSNERERRGF
ncbi:MAG: hypothetical protein QOI65_980 [Thermoleophilaceae bacterium]|jgi:hypothetical protein|nr:hypothetical protein [Thermoleophilaceae bacterium]